MAVLSLEAVTILFPSGEKAVLFIDLVCPGRSAIIFLVCASHILAVLSSEAGRFCFHRVRKQPCSQCLYVLRGQRSNSRFGIPYFGSFVVGSGDDFVSIGRESGAVYSVCVSSDIGDPFPGLYIPYFGTTVVESSDDFISIG